MTKLSKFLLPLAIVLFAVGCTNWGASFLYGILKPSAAVLVVVVFLQELMPKESEPAQEEPAVPASERGHAK
jgi:hypothetical protein